MRTGFEISAPSVTLQEAQKEYESLSVEEKERVNRDVHGGHDTEGQDNETEEQRRIGLEQMDFFLLDIPDDSKRHYEQALKVNPGYAKDPCRRLQFLRCELFDAKKAAVRYVNYWTEKVKLWGENCAFRSIQVSDFSEEDQIALRQGGFQFLTQSLDKFNRGVMLVDPCRFDHRVNNWKSNVRLLWYMHEALLENHTVQKNGVVYIHGLGKENSLTGRDRKIDLLGIHLVRYALPTRVVAVHHIVNSKLIQFVVPFVLYLMGSDIRSRYKLHHYSRDVIVKLVPFGIDKSIIPVDWLGEAPSMYDEWLDSRQRNNL